MKPIFSLSITLCLLFVSAPAIHAQVSNPTQIQTIRGGDNPIYRVTINVVARDVDAVNYRSSWAFDADRLSGNTLANGCEGNGRS
jgi:hypothetical protein